MAAAGALAEMGGMGGGKGMRGRGPMPQKATTQKSAPGGLDSYIRDLLDYGRELQLTDAQREKIRGIRAQMLKDAEVVYSSLEKQQQALITALENDIPDFFMAREKMKTITAAMFQMQTMGIDGFEKTYAVLTEDQKNIYSKMKIKEKAEAIRAQKDAENTRLSEGEMPPGGMGGGPGMGSPGGMGQ